MNDAEEEVNYDEAGQGEYDSGPFCRHWGDPSDCEQECAACGHACCRHDQGEDSSCREDGCDCEEWQEPP